MCVTPKLIIEADGGQHTEQAAYDHARTAYLNSLGLYRAAFLESRDFAADKRRTGGNPAHVARIGKQPAR